jgi:hypothetical protein
MCRGPRRRRVSPRCQVPLWSDGDAIIGVLELAPLEEPGGEPEGGELGSLLGTLGATQARLRRVIVPPDLRGSMRLMPNHAVAARLREDAIAQLASQVRRSLQTHIQRHCCGMRVLFMNARQGPNFLFCATHGTKCVLLVSVTGGSALSLRVGRAQRMRGVRGLCELVTKETDRPTFWQGAPERSMSFLAWGDRQACHG